MSILHEYVNKLHWCWSSPMDQWLKNMIHHDYYININPYMWLQNDSIRHLQNMPLINVTELTKDTALNQHRMMNQ